MEEPLGLKTSRYRWSGHTVNVAMLVAGASSGGPSERIACTTCSVPNVIAEAVMFMQRFAVRTLVVDGQTIERV